MAYAPLIRYRRRPFDGDYALTGRFLDTSPPDWSAARPHLGRDYALPTGTPLYASTFGLITELEVDDGSFGLNVVVDCQARDGKATEFYDLTAHMSRVDVRVGQRVEPGALLGLSGATGYVSGPHLHWQTSRNVRAFPRDPGVMVDPESFPIESLDVPTPPAPDVDGEMTAFMADLCAGMGWAPTPWRLDVLRYWADQEDDQAWRLLLQAHNPLATTRVTGDVVGTWNSSGVKLYRDRAAGVVATVETLNLDYYANIRRSFVDQVGYPEAIGPRNFTTWVGSDVYGRRIVDYMNTTPASADPEHTIPDPPAALDAEALNAAMQKRMTLSRLANDPELWRVERAVELLTQHGGILREVTL